MNEWRFFFRVILKTLCFLFLAWEAANIFSKCLSKPEITGQIFLLCFLTYHSASRLPSFIPQAKHLHLQPQGPAKSSQAHQVLSCLQAFAECNSFLLEFSASLHVNSSLSFKTLQSLPSPTVPESSLQHIRQCCPGIICFCACPYWILAIWRADVMSYPSLDPLGLACSRCFINILKSKCHICKGFQCQAQFSGHYMYWLF